MVSWPLLQGPGPSRRSYARGEDDPAEAMVVRSTGPKPRRSPGHWRTIRPLQQVIRGVGVPHTRQRAVEASSGFPVEEAFG